MTLKKKCSIFQRIKSSILNFFKPTPSGIISNSQQQSREICSPPNPQRPQEDTSLFPNPQQFHESCQSQDFAFPTPIIMYILLTSPDAYQKLIKCCKIFFKNYPLFVVNDLQYGCGENEYSHVYMNICYNKKIDIENSKNKIWVSKKFCINNENNACFASAIVPKIYRYNVEELELVKQILSYDNLKFLSNGVKKCYIYKCIVKYQNGKDVPLENIVEFFAYAKLVEIHVFYEDDHRIYLRSK